jgi:hypothetical protein
MAEETTSEGLDEPEVLRGFKKFKSKLSPKCLGMPSFFNLEPYLPNELYKLFQFIALVNMFSLCPRIMSSGDTSR